MLKISTLPYPDNPADLFAQTIDLPWCIFLDSSFPYLRQGRYDIIAAQPTITIETFTNTTRISTDHSTSYSSNDPLSILKSYLPIQETTFTDLPFSGGALGYFAYDLSSQIGGMRCAATSELKIPKMAVGIYHWAVIVDHHQRKTYLIYHDDVVKQPTVSTLTGLFSKYPKQKHKIGFIPHGEITTNMSRAEYAHRFAKVKQYIRDGDCYQINLAQRFSLPVEGNDWSAYRQLRSLSPAPYASYMKIPKLAILSTSPERFLQVCDRQVETKPIKGTRPRASSPEADTALAEDLLNSHKDRAENLMIVDLLRNDLGRICSIGSIKVPKLFELESFSTVHHMVSTITANLPSDAHPVDLLRNCFPGGSITGAPKIRAMEIIAELEPHNRHVYCGAIGYISFNGNMDTNIAIRTLLSYQKTVFFWAGGGIVYDSKLASEYDECFDKAAAMLALLNCEK